MKPGQQRFLPLVLLLAAMLGTMLLAHRRQVTGAPSAYPVLSAAADAEHEATRLPAHLLPLSDADEIRIGDHLTAQYTAGPTLNAPQQEVEHYLQTVTTRVTARTRRRLPWTVHYLPGPGFVNAFAVPGGTPRFCCVRLAA